MMRAGGELRRGRHMLRAGVTWQVKLLKDGVVHLERDETGEVDKLTLEQWYRECSSGVTKMVGVANAHLSDKEQALQKLDFADLPGNVRASGTQKFFYARAFNDPVGFYEAYLPELPREERLLPNKSKHQLEPFAKLVHRAFVALYNDELVQLFERPGATARQRTRKARSLVPVPAHFLRVPSKSTYCQWLTQWDDIAARNGQPDIRLMASKYHDRGPKERLMSANVQDWLEEAIDTIWLSPSLRKKTKVFEALKRKVTEHNAANPTQELDCPSQGHVNRYIRETVDRDTAVRRRRGDKVADQEFKQVGEGPQPTSVMEVVEVDHTRLDVDVFEDETGFKLGRPWVTTALDRYSRLPVGVHVHFDGPSLAAVMHALRDTMMTKEYLRKEVPALDYDYPGCGRPRSYFFDRGTDFDNDHVRDVSLEFDVAIEYEPVGCPQYKGRMERWNRTAQEEVSHPLPGATPPHDGDGYRRDADGRAYIGLKAFRRRLMFWITMIYARSPHRTLRMTPLQKWEEGSAKRLPRPLPPLESLRILLNRVEYLKPSAKGVQWNHLRWNGEVLRDIRTSPSFRKGQLVKVRIDDSDVSRAWVTNPFTRALDLLTPVYKDYMPELTMYQHRMALLLSDERMESARDEPSLIEAKKLLEEEVDALLDTKAKHKKSNGAAARFKAVKSVDTGSRSASAPKAARAAQVPVAATSDEDDGLPVMREVRKKSGKTVKG